MLVLAPRRPRQNEFFLEGVATPSNIIFRLYHRPTGLVVESAFPQNHPLPPFDATVRELYDRFRESLNLQRESHLAL